MYACNYYCCTTVNPLLMHVISQPTTIHIQLMSATCYKKSDRFIIRSGLFNYEIMTAVLVFCSWTWSCVDWHSIWHCWHQTAFLDLAWYWPKRLRSPLFCSLDKLLFSCIVYSGIHDCVPWHESIDWSWSWWRVKNGGWWVGVCIVHFQLLSHVLSSALSAVLSLVSSGWNFSHWKWWGHGVYYLGLAMSIFFLNLDIELAGIPKVFVV
jgi:hypothetical protein